MKTVYLYATAITPETGGSHTILINLLNNLQRFTSEKTRLILLAPQAYIPLAKEKGIEHIVIDHNKKWLKRLFWERFVGSQVISNSPENCVFSLQNTLPHVGNFVQTVAYVHTSICFDRDIKIPLHHWRENLKKYFYASAIKKSLSPTTTLLVQSLWMRTVTSSTLDIPRERVHIATPNIQRYDDLHTKRVQPTILTLFYPAKFYFHKNHEIIFEALRVISKRHPTTNLKIILTLDEKYFVKFRNLYPDVFDSSHFEIENLGYVKHEVVNQTYKVSSALLFPSILETFGLPLIEARQKGIPILCSDLPYAKEVLTNYPLVHYFNSQNAEAVADAIVRELPTLEAKQKDISPLALEKSVPTQTSATTLLEVLRQLLASQQKISSLDS